MNVKPSTVYWETGDEVLGWVGSVASSQPRLASVILSVVSWNTKPSQIPH